MPDCTHVENQMQNISDALNLFDRLATGIDVNVQFRKLKAALGVSNLSRASDDNDNGSPKYFDYLFYVDFEASMADPNSQNALRHLEEFATFLRVLGSYPADNSQP
ncbi:hypothetical protein IFM89_030140 [Coptis chinensis]|uniref:Arogenate dehydratase n=1 Tax=Coptis chinensis TaxID=261450 RepID=A0A835LD00_9MAGN|nr:hypothetical protein IFM89_030140 [Coptis chinensis]